MVWYNLTIGKYHLKYIALNPIEKEYPLCDSKGNPLKVVIEGERQNKYFVDDKGNKSFKSFRLVNNKPLAKLDKTKEVNTFKEVDEKEVEDLLTEKEYIVDCDFLLEELQNTNKALKFAFTNGNGFKVYIAYVYVDNLYNMLFMKLGRTQKSQIITNIKELMKNKSKATNISLTIEGVDKARVEDLIQI